MTYRIRSTSLLALALVAVVATACAEKLEAPVQDAEPQAVPEELADLAPAADASTAQAPEAGAAPAEPAGAHFTANGELRSPMESRVTVRVPGRVAEIYADEGEFVRRGEPLLRLETDYSRLEVDRARAEAERAGATLEEARREAGRKLELFERGSVPPATRDRATTALAQAEAGAAVARAALDVAERRLDDATLAAPFTGVVVSRQAAVGAFVDEKSGAFLLAQTEPLRLRFDVPERLFRDIRRGLAVNATLDAYPGETFRGTVSVIGQVVDPQSRTIFVEAELANEDGRLKPGMFARVEIGFE